jgi:ABC-type Fe3+-hydroxamate transport system substrate-binding protein
MIYTDQLQRKIELPENPKRIISLVPSQTELLADLGLEEEVVGITKFCVHPAAWYKEKTKIGGTKSFHLDRIRDLHPDLIIGNKEENDKEQIKTLIEEYPVWLSDVKNLPDALEMIRSIAGITGTESCGNRIAKDIERSFVELATQQMGRRPIRVAYLIWNKPLMVAGGDTFIHSMLKRAGFENVFVKQPRYPEIKLEELSAAQPEVIFLSSEPFPFKAKHIDFYQQINASTKVLLVNGELFSWYGSRLKLSAPYFQELYAQCLTNH